jgi:hypothetical protein
MTTTPKKHTRIQMWVLLHQLVVIRFYVAKGMISTLWDKSVHDISNEGAIQCQTPEVS